MANLRGIVSQLTGAGRRGAAGGAGRRSVGGRGAVGGRRSAGGAGGQDQAVRGLRKLLRRAR